MLATQDVHPSGVATELKQLLHQVDLLLLQASGVAARFAATDEYDYEGYASPIDWIRFNCHQTSSVAADLIAVGENLERTRESAQALSNGEIGFAHLKVMARTADAVGTKFDEAALLKKARENSPGKLHHICQHYRHAADAERYAAEQAEQVEQRRLKLSTWMDGSLLISGQLDPVGGAALLTALAPLARRSGAHDYRDQEQRNADALIELASGGGSQAQIQVTSSLETLLALSGAPAAEMEHSLPVSSKTIERLACDSSIARVLLDSESVVIDVGRSKRVVSEPGRRALAARDGHCRWPECERPRRGARLITWSIGPVEATPAWTT